MRLTSQLYLLILFSLHTLLIAQDTAVVDSTSESEGPELYLVDGDKAHEELDNEKALEFYKQVVAVAPDNYEALWKLSRAYVDVGDTYTDIEKRKEYFSKGEKLSGKAVSINPGHINHHLELGISYEKLKDKGSAVAEYKKALALHKKDADDDRYKQKAGERLKKLEK